MPLPLQRAKMMREQLGFALNREGYFAEAEKVLTEVIAEFGASSETNALLGRTYKDRWDPERESAVGAREHGRNLGLIRAMREGRGDAMAWLQRIEDILRERAKRLEPPKAEG